MDDYSLRSIGEEDLRLIMEWRTSDRIRDNMYQVRMITWDEHVRWYREQVCTGKYVYQLFQAGNVPLGAIYFNSFNYESESAFWGFYLGAERYPKGSGFEMGKLGLQFGFRNLELRKINGECFARNDASIRFHERLGFQLEGRFIEHVRHGDRLEDVIRFGLLARNYRFAQ